MIKELNKLFICNNIFNYLIQNKFELIENIYKQGYIMFVQTKPNDLYMYIEIIFCKCIIYTNSKIKLGVILKFI